MNQATQGTALDLREFFSATDKAEAVAVAAIETILKPLTDEELDVVFERVAEHYPFNQWLANLICDEFSRRPLLDEEPSHTHAGAPYAHLREDRPTTQQEGN